MPEPYENCSEVARVLARISEEYEAARNGFTGLACGTAKHAFINARMENMGRLHNKLQALVGDEAMALIAERLNSLP